MNTKVAATLIITSLASFIVAGCATETAEEAPSDVGESTEAISAGIVAACGQQIVDAGVACASHIQCAVGVVRQYVGGASADGVVKAIGACFDSVRESVECANAARELVQCGIEFHRGHKAVCKSPSTIGPMSMKLTCGGK